MCILKVFSIVQSVCLKTLSTWKAQIQVFCHQYAQDLPNVVGLPAEFELWQTIWTEKKEKAKDILEKNVSTLKSAKRLHHPTDSCNNPCYILFKSSIGGM